MLETGGDLLSRAVSSQVPSALKGLTSVFGMGTGDPLRHCHRKALVCCLLVLVPGLWLAFALLRLRSTCLACLPSRSSHQLFRTSTTAHMKNEQACPLSQWSQVCAFRHSLFKSSPRPISTGKLNTLLHLHRRPISRSSPGGLTSF